MTIEAKGQGESFFLCLALGYLFGALSGIVFGEKRFKSLKISVLLQILKTCFFALFFVCCKNYYNLPSLKVYFLLAYYLGFYIYLKTLAKIIAKFDEKLYNKARIIVLKVGYLYYDARKKKKNSIGNNRVGGATALSFNRGDGLPNGDHKRQKNKNPKPRGANRATRKRAGNPNRRHRALA